MMKTVLTCVISSLANAASAKQTVVKIPTDIQGTILFQAYYNGIMHGVLEISGRGFFSHSRHNVFRCRIRCCVPKAEGEHDA